MITTLALFLLNTTSIAVGTLVANLGILWVIGNRAKAMEERNYEAIMAHRKEVLDRFNEEVKKKQDYLRMES